MASEDKGTLVQQFCAVTGATLQTGQRLLEACNNDLEMAIGMHLDTGGSGDPTDVGASSSGTSGACGNDGDDVRAPIPQKQEVLVEEEYGYSFGFRGRRRPVRSVFDGFRDFQAETRQQEMMAANQNLPAVSVNKKRKTLEDLFRPPIDLIHKGTFYSARDGGTASNKWLIVNIQNVQEFPCQALNRDVWSNKAVKSIIKEHFIFWQVYHDSEEGQKFSQFYSVDRWPYIAVLDPRTGEKMVEWSKVDPLTFCDLVTQFLSSHPVPDASSSPPAKRLKRSDSIIDASEDMQIEAAIKASLEQSKSTVSPKQALVTIDDSESEYDDVETFSDSDDDNESPSTEHSPRKSPVKNQTSSKIDTQESNSSVNSLSSQNSSSSTSHSCKNYNSDCTSSKGKAIISNKTTVLQPSSNGAGCGESNGQESHHGEKWRQYLGDKNDPESCIMVRFADGKREQFSVPCSSKLMALVQFVIAKGYSNEQYELVTNYPRRKLSFLDFDSTLKEIGLFPQETVFVQER